MTLVAGGGGFAEPMTDEQQHQVSGYVPAYMHKVLDVVCIANVLLYCDMFCADNASCRSLQSAKYSAFYACTGIQSPPNCQCHDEVTMIVHVQAVLSRLLLMLGSLVIMCLLLF